ncbi:MAG TPA: hypothetical protein VFR94_08930 [Nitrososphaeraceae archaeon]|nr:hypothetical protein [Nitrososphaeraceae archaeon]
MLTWSDRFDEMSREQKMFPHSQLSPPYPPDTNQAQNQDDFSLQLARTIFNNQL